MTTPTTNPTLAAPAPNPMKPKIPRKYMPEGYEVLYEDRDLLVGDKAAGFVTVEAKWSNGDSVRDSVTNYIRKGNLRARNEAYVVHRLDQATTGVLIFAKSEAAQTFMKENWPTTTKTYYAIVHGHFAEKTGKMSSYLEEGEDYFVHSNQTAQGRLSHTEYEVIEESEKYSLLRINLLTGRKNQIRVHMSEAGHAVVGDPKYGGRAGGAGPVVASRKGRPGSGGAQKLALHSASIEFTHPHSKKRIKVEAPLPPHFARLMAEKAPKVAGPSKPTAVQA